MENLVVAASNFTAVLPIYTAFVHRDILTASTLIFVVGASVASHLVENHKHGMPGFFPGFPKDSSYLLTKIDVFACVLVVLRMGPLLYPCLAAIPWSQWLIAIGLFGLLQASEWDKHNPRYKRRYIFMHCLWHMGVFLHLYNVLRHYVYV